MTASPTQSSLWTPLLMLCYFFAVSSFRFATAEATGMLYGVCVILACVALFAFISSVFVSIVLVGVVAWFVGGVQAWLVSALAIPTEPSNCTWVLGWAQGTSIGACVLALLMTGLHHASEREHSPSPSSRRVMFMLLCFVFFTFITTLAGHYLWPISALRQDALAAMSAMSLGAPSALLWFILYDTVRERISIRRSKASTEDGEVAIDVLESSNALADLLSFFGRVIVGMLRGVRHLIDSIAD